MEGRFLLKEGGGAGAGFGHALEISEEEGGRRGGVGLEGVGVGCWSP